MNKEGHRKLVLLLLGMAAVWFALRYLLSLAVPFVIGGVIAVTAEAGVGRLQKWLHIPRGGAVGICVSLTLILFAAAVSLLAAVAVKELGNAARLAPDVGKTVSEGLMVMEDFLVGMADRAPDTLRPILIQTVTRTFRDGTTLISQVTDRLPGVVAGTVGALSRGALTVGTGVLAGFMISARLPKIKAWLREKLPHTQTARILRNVKTTFGRWIIAQGKLMGLTFLVVFFGFILLKIPFAPLWAALVALVDAVPVLGTGTVLIPWAVISFLEQNTLRGVGLLVTYTLALILRTVWEPRLVGKSLGIDPLVSLAAFYVGFRLWGVAGMILAPMAAALGKSLLQQFTNNS